MDADKKMKISMTCMGAEAFVKQYFKDFDRNRHAVSKLYTEDAKLLWDGNCIEGASKITTFHENLPGSIHNVECYDAQPLQDEATGGQLMFIISTSGTVQFDDNDKRAFYQNFVITKINDIWKVTSDCFRFCS